MLERELDLGLIHQLTVELAETRFALARAGKALALVESKLNLTQAEKNQLAGFQTLADALGKPHVVSGKLKAALTRVVAGRKRIAAVVAKTHGDIKAHVPH